MSASTTAVSTKRQIRQSLSRWRGSLDEQQLPLFRDFVEDTLNRIRGPFLAHHAPKEVLEALEVAFEFARHRPRSSVNVDVRPGKTKGAITLSNMQDQAFIVDTIRLFLRRAGAEWWGGFNLVFHAKRDQEGNLIGVGNETDEAESLVLLESDVGTLFDPSANATDHLRETLELARAMVTDFQAMTRTVERFVERSEVLAERLPDRADAFQETAAFLKWLLRENFVFMGVNAGEPLGFLRVDSRYASPPAGEWPPAHQPLTVQVRKSRMESPVHRAGRIDEIRVTLREDGTEHTLFLRGMFTYRAVTQPSRNVPILRGVLANILDEEQSRPGSFRYKGISNVFDSLPTEFLFTASTKAIGEMVDLVFEAELQQEVGVTFSMTGPESAFFLVTMPKTEYSDELRREVEAEIVGALKATYSDHGLFVGRYDTVLLHYYLTGVVHPGDSGIEALTERIRDMATPWLAQLWQGLSDRHDDETADRLADTYGRAFPDEWLRHTSVERAVRDIEMLESLSGKKNLVADLYETDDHRLSLVLYQAQDTYLTDILPVLDNFGLVARDSKAIAVASRGGQLHLDLFHLEATKGVGQEAKIIDRAELLVPAIEAVFAGDVEADRLNQLVVSAALQWQEVDVIRGLMRYLRQLHVKLSIVRMREILLSQPKLVRNLVQLFHARFDPDLAGDRDTATRAAEAQVRGDLKSIRAHDEDILFSSLLTLLLAMIRTNYYRTDRKSHYLSFKFDCAQIKEMGPRRPLYEVYVHNIEVEGVHLRFGKVARGGIRWSDRDDFRTEVLGLVTTQQVKNVVIVPEGAKGGFYLKRPSRDASVRRQEADKHYRTFIRGLLDITDNSQLGAIVKPSRVVCHDADDPYLVVAADKGTAHLSDTANALSIEYGHWLGDAFASGGSNGYDHKKVGITARGAWVLVRRNFAEIGKDPYSEAFTCVGIGDMSGDVFGNGLIETPHAKLFAAFNHVHIFLDPNPDVNASYEERVRLFRAERKGGWENYDTRLISAGGGVFERSAKSIPLSPEAQAMLGLPVAEAEPDTVIKHILRMDVDLLWNGGIGTYVKASTETHADADDRSNDGLRVDGSELRCRMVGEGGNLGFTQRGRIEAALHGVRLNTDAIDNSGGVDMSDHEVNLKILLGSVVARGELDTEARNDLLRRMTDEVAQLVIADNDLQGRQISRDQIRSRENIYVFGRAIAFIEAEMGQRREALQLPSDKELAGRAEAGSGLTRPELAVLSAWVKMYVFRELMRGTPKALPGYATLLIHYFPTELRERYANDIRNHMLADEIAMTVATTRMVADGGAAWIPMTIETTGRPLHDIASAYLQAQTLAGVGDLREALEANRIGDALHASYRAWNRIDQSVREVATRWLTDGTAAPDATAAQAILEAAVLAASLQPADIAGRDRQLSEELRRLGLKDGQAERVVAAQYLPIAAAASQAAAHAGANLRSMTRRYLAVARATRLQEVLDELSRRSATGRWDPVALHILARRFQRLLLNFVGSTASADDAASVDDLANRFAAGPLAEARRQVTSLLAGEAQPPVAALIVLEERLSAVAARARG
jgi:glutamate dehydrogenase